MKQPVDTVKHVPVLYKLATVGSLDPLFHSCDEAGLIFEHAGNRVFHQLPGVLAIGKGQLLESHFNVGREMNFHPVQGAREPGMRQHRETEAPEFRVAGFPPRGSQKGKAR